MKKLATLTLITFLSFEAYADNYQIYFPSQSQFVDHDSNPSTAMQLPLEKQNAYIVNTDSNVVQTVSLSEYLSTNLPQFGSGYSTQVDFHGSQRVVQDFIGDKLIIRDNNLITVGDLSPNSNTQYQFDRVSEINVSTGEVVRDYIIARSQAAYDAALAAGYDVKLAAGAANLPTDSTMSTFRTFSQNTTTTGGSVDTNGGFFAEKISSSSGASLLRQEADGSVHVGQNSFVFRDSAISSNSNDILSSSVNRLQLGDSPNHRTIVEGTLEIQNPTAPNHAATKGYVDENFYKRNYVDGSVAMAMAMSSLPRSLNGKTMLGIGTGVHNGQAALAVGLSKSLVEKGLHFNISISHSNAATTSGAASVGYEF